MSECLFLLTFSQSEDVISLAKALGRRVVVSRRQSGVVERLATSGADIALVDLRIISNEYGAEKMAKAVDQLSDFAESNGFPLVAIIDGNTPEQAAALSQIAVSQILQMPTSQTILAATLQIARTMAGRRYDQDDQEKAESTNVPKDSHGARASDNMDGIRSGSFARAWLGDVRFSHESSLSLLLLSLRDLERINERHDRSVGNAVIQLAGARIKNYVEKQYGASTVVARMAGKEFMIAISGAHPSAELRGFADGLLAAVAKPYAVGDLMLATTGRMGIASSSENEQGLDTLKRASVALAATMARDGQDVIFASKLGQGSESDVDEYAQLEQDLAQAIGKEQIEIVLQPQFRVADNHLIGAEALARWRHPSLGLLGAELLFTVADRCGMRESISEAIQSQAIQIAAKWSPALSDLKLSVNLGAPELGEADYCARLAQVLEHAKFDPKRLTIELTEESLVRNFDAARDQLMRLRDMGITVAVDDFGTGYSSLLYLKNLPIDYLKLDKGMTPDIRGNGKDRIVLRSIIAMGQAIGLKIIAEGVEQHEELAMLRDEGCDIYQGYLRSLPLSPNEFEQYALKCD